MRRLLLGRAGTGKTHACLDLLVTALEKGKKPLLLVPTYAQAEHLRHLLLDRTGGLSAHTVETFTSLAERITRRKVRTLVPPPVRDRLAARVLEEVFPEAASQAGLRAEFLSAVKEIKEQGAPRDQVVAHAQAHFPAGARGRLLFEAYARYVDELAGLDHEDLLLEARDNLRTERVGADVLLVDGFHDFTPVERQILDRVAARAKDAVVTLPLDPDDRTNAIFATAARTAREFEGYEQVPLDENRRAGGALAELERRLFAEPTAPYHPGDAIDVIACSSEEDEADRLARRVAASARPFKDFLVVRRSFDGLQGTYRAAFQRHGVPLRFFGPQPLGTTPAARAATLLLRRLAGDDDLRAALPLLRSPYLLDAPPAREVDWLARHLRRQGEPDLDEFPGVRTALDVDPEARLPDLLPRRLGVRDALVENPDGDEEIAHVARFLALLQQEADAVGDVPLADAAQRVLRRIPLLKGQVPDRRHDCVYAVEALDARQWEKPVVLVAGLGTQSFPHQIRQDLFLRDEERRAFAEERGVHMPLRSRGEDEERYLFYVALTRAREELVLTWAAFDEEGTALPPSPYLDETLAHFSDKGPAKVPLSRLFATPDEAIFLRDLLPIVADGLHHGEPVAAALYEREAVPRAELAFVRRHALARSRPIRALPVDPAARLTAYGINDYLRCPYLYLARRVLRVQPARPDVLDPMTRGIIVHEALERCATDLRDAGTIFDEIFHEKAGGFLLGLFDEAQRRWMRAAVVRTAEEVRARPSLRVEEEFELAVGDVKLRGRVDRIDEYAAGELVRDYKTGRADLKKVLRGEDVQLDVYLLALENPAGALYDRVRRGDATGFVLAELRDEVKGKVEVLTRAQIAARREAIRRRIAETAEAARAGRLSVKPREPEDCTRRRCDAYDLCRVARARWLAKAAREPEK